MSGLCAHPRRPYRARPGVESHRGIFDHADAVFFERAAHAIVIEPPVVIAEHGDDAGRGTKPAKLRGNRLRRNEAASDDTLNDQVAEYAHDVGVRGIGPIHDPPQLAQAVERRPDVQIRQDRNAQRP